MVPALCNHPGLCLSSPLLVCKGRTRRFFGSRLWLTRYEKTMVHGVCRVWRNCLVSSALSDKYICASGAIYTNVFPAPPRVIARLVKLRTQRGQGPEGMVGHTPRCLFHKSTTGPWKSRAKARPTGARRGPGGKPSENQAVARRWCSGGVLNAEIHCS